MSKANEILSFASPGLSFNIAAKRILSDLQREKIKTQSHSLFEIALSLGKIAEDVPDDDLIEKAYLKFNRLCRLGDVELTSREIRYVTYAMGRITNQAKMKILLQLLQKRWKDRFFNGILIFLLTNWESVDEPAQSEVRKLFVDKLQSYSGKKDKFLLLKKNAHFFNINGAEMLGI